MDNQSKIQLFTNEELDMKVRVVEINGEPWLVGKDVAEVLGYANPSKAVLNHVDPEDKIMEMITHSQNRKVVKTQTTLINERGVLSLLQRSRLRNTQKQELIKSLGLKEKFVLTSRKEIEFIDQLEETLKPFNLIGIRQYKINSYKIDYYIPSLNLAIEYDENDHRGYSYEAHEGRQKEIEDILNCRFIRVTDDNTNNFNIGLVLKEMFNM